MSGQTNERAFETHVEEVLLQQGGWQSGINAEWDVERVKRPPIASLDRAPMRLRAWAGSAGSGARMVHRVTDRPAGS
jgi:hypothetical protein